MAADMAGRLAVLAAKRKSLMGGTAPKSKLAMAVEETKSPLEKLIDVLYAAYDCEEDQAEGGSEESGKPEKASSSDSD